MAHSGIRAASRKNVNVEKEAALAANAQISVVLPETLRGHHRKQEDTSSRCLILKVWLRC